MDNGCTQFDAEHFVAKKRMVHEMDSFGCSC
jgi:hypothetical protein